MKKIKKEELLQKLTKYIERQKSYSDTPKEYCCDINGFTIFFSDYRISVYEKYFSIVFDGFSETHTIEYRSSFQNVIYFDYEYYEII